METLTISCYFMGEKFEQSTGSEVKPELEHTREHNQANYGHNITMVMTYIRHEQPGKNTQGMSADFLTEAGEQSAANRAKERQTENLKIYSSPKKRAKRTVDLVAENIDQNIRVINKTFEQSPSVKRPEGEEKNQFIVREIPELDVVKNMPTMWMEGMAKAKELMTNGDKHSELDLTTQYILDNPERARELNTLTPEEVASEMAQRIMHEIGMSNKFLNDSEVELLHSTHGPRFELFLQQVMVNERGELGFKHVDEIGGAINPGEGFQMIEKRTEKDTPDTDNYTLEIQFRDKTYGVDLQRLKELTQLYEKQVKDKFKPKQ